MITLLNKFRIDYSDVFLIPDITRKPKPETLREFDNLIKPFRAQGDTPSVYITESELAAMQQKVTFSFLINKISIICDFFRLTVNSGLASSFCIIPATRLWWY